MKSNPLPRQFRQNQDIPSNCIYYTNIQNVDRLNYRFIGTRLKNSHLNMAGHPTSVGL